MCKIRPFLFTAAWLASWSTTAALAGPVVQIGQNFTGSTFGSDLRLSPADSNGAIGPAHFVELINGRYSVYDKTSGSRIQTMTDLQFWSAAGVSLGSTQGVSDPRLVFDLDSQRWFASAIDISGGRRQNSNQFLLAVSETADPTGMWQAVSFASDPNGVLFADFPTLGLDKDGVYLSGDMFDASGNSVGPTLVSIPKRAVLSNPPDVSGRVGFGALTYSARGDILQPAQASGQPTTPESVVAVGDLGIDFQTHSTLVLSTVTGASGSAADLVDPGVTLTVPAYAVPINPTQPDGSNNLDNGDARIAASVRRVGDVLYATHAIEVDKRAAVRWYRIDAAAQTLLDSGTITDPNLDLFYPSIAANEQGTVLIACNGSSSTTYVSSYAAAGQVVNGTLTFGPLTLLKSGSASYQYTDSTGTSRWGDYSTTSVDPLDPTRFWTIQMVAVGTGTWATQITEIITNPVQSPRLMVKATGRGLLVNWPATGGSFQLESSPVLGPGASWTPVTQPTAVQNNVNAVSIETSENQVFLRLVGPSDSGSSQN